MYCRQYSGKVVMRRRTISDPLERRRLPRICRRSFTLENAPYQIEIENKLDQYGDDRRDRNEHDEWMQFRKELIFGELRIASRHSHHAHRVHRDEDAIDADKGDPEVDSTKRLIHHSAKHLGKPEIGRGKHT